MSARPDPDPRLRARVRMGAGAALVLLLVGLAIAVFVTAISPRGATAVVAPEALPSGAAESPVAVAVTTPLFVHVLGQVERPGLYELAEGDRAVDAVAAAGGLTKKADPAGINLARPLSDGEQLYVPAVGEKPESGGGGGGGSGTGDGKINLNTADAATLETLPRIGPAMAQRIVEWREANGRFATVDDLLAVTGIGAKTLDGLRPHVTT